MVDHTLYTLHALADEALLRRLAGTSGLRPAAVLGALRKGLAELVAQERESVSGVVEHLMEIDRRELALDLGSSSLYEYCVKKLGYSRQAAYFRMRAAQAARRFPEVLAGLKSGMLHLDAVVRLCPHLNQENQARLLAQAEGATEREVKELVARLQTRTPPERDLITVVAPRRPDPALAVVAADPDAAIPALNANSTREKPTPNPEPVDIISPPRHRFHFTGDDELFLMIERLRGLLRHKYPEGQLEGIFKEAARTLLETLERARRPSMPRVNRRQAGALPKSQRHGSRVVPRTVKRQVWERDGGRCAYLAVHGRRCESRDALEYDHITAWADGGRSDAVENIRLLCRPHNQRLGRRASATVGESREPACR